jgi:hypothetical protein
MQVSSPWFKTSVVNDEYLDVLSIRTIPSSNDDKLYTIQEQYTHRPDLLAYDLYDDFRLWWIFAQRNMDIIQDPIYDFEAGVQIYLPLAANVNRYLGL